MKKKLSILIQCKLFGLHNWTSKGLKKEKLILTTDMNGDEITKVMEDYSRMYCDRCELDSKLNHRIKDIFSSYE